MLQDKVLHQSLVCFINTHSAVWRDYFWYLVTSIMRKCRAKPRPSTRQLICSSEFGLQCNTYEGINLSWRNTDSTSTPGPYWGFCLRSDLLTKHCWNIVSSFKNCPTNDMLKNLRFPYYLDWFYCLNVLVLLAKWPKAFQPAGIDSSQLCSYIRCRYCIPLPIISENDWIWLTIWHIHWDICFVKTGCC